MCRSSPQYVMKNKLTCKIIYRRVEKKKKHSRITLHIKNNVLLIRFPNFWNTDDGSTRGIMRTGTTRFSFLSFS